MVSAFFFFFFLDVYLNFLLVIYAQNRLFMRFLLYIWLQPLLNKCSFQT